MNLNDYIAVINGDRKEGSSVKYVTPLLKDKDAFKYTFEEWTKFAIECGANVSVGP